MGDLIGFLLGDLEFALARAVTSRLDATSMIRMLRYLAAISLSENHFHKLSPILDKIDYVRDDRNLIVHGIWARNSRGTPLAFSLRQKAPTPTEVVAETFDDSRMRTLIHTIVALHRELLLVMYEIGWSLHEKSAPPPPEEA
ncbi:MAG: hypothetical protein JO216_12510 [Hyphomicrobiales bacterium]|nr:hypothetical protein [Hyphomicrobiales bacterium]